jgi:predicted component of type VI protein secretion system
LNILKFISDIFKKSKEKKQQEIIPNNIRQSNNLKTEYNMAKKTVITQVQDVEVNESIIEFPQNRAFLAEQLTYNEPSKPEISRGMKTVDEVFEHYKPKVDVDFQDSQGASKKETLAFKTLADFGVKGLTQQSPFLQELEMQKEEYQKIIKQLKSNKQLKQAIAHVETKQALLNSILALMKELEASK